MDQRQPPVVFVHPGLKQPHHVEALQARQNSRRGHAGLRRDHRDFIAHHDAQGVGQFLAENDAELAGPQIVERPLNHLAADVGHLSFLGRQNPLDQRAADQRGVIEHRLSANVGRAAGDPRIFQGPIAHRAPVVHHAVPAVDGGVRRHRQNSAAHFLLKTVHDRKDGDQRGDA